MKNLYCDIDNTVSNQFLRIKKKFSGNNMQTLLHNKKIILEDHLIQNSKFSLDAFSNKYKINWLSARPTSLYKITEQWLQLKKLPINSIVLVNSHDEKIRYLKKNIVDLYIDDMKYDYFTFKPKLMTRYIAKIKKINIKYEIFNNNWKDLVKKYV
jgi:uncharacterized HAD superfamily protein